MAHCTPYRAVVSAAALFFFISGLYANPESADEASLPTTELRFLLFYDRTEVSELDLKTGESSYLPIRGATSSLSQPYHAPLQPNWRLGRMIPTCCGAPDFTPRAEAEALEASQQLLVVFRPEDAVEDELDLVVVDGSAPAFSGGDYLFVNLTDTPILGIIGEAKLSLDPGSHQVAKTAPSEQRGERAVCYIRLAYLDEAATAKPFFTSEWRYSKTARTITLFYKDPRTGKLRLHVVHDYL